MKKGDLVRRVRFSELADAGTIGHRAQEILQLHEEYWREPAVVVKGPYESSRSHETTSGQPYVAMHSAIDVLYRGTIHEGITVGDFERV